MERQGRQGQLGEPTSEVGMTPGPLASDSAVVESAVANPGAGSADPMLTSVSHDNDLTVASADGKQSEELLVPLLKYLSIREDEAAVCTGV